MSRRECGWRRPKVPGPGVGAAPARAMPGSLGYPSESIPVAGSQEQVRNRTVSTLLSADSPGAQSNYFLDCHSATTTLLFGVLLLLFKRRASHPGAVR